MDISVPAGNAFLDIPRVVGHRINTDVLQNDHGHTALNNAEEDVVVAWSLKRYGESETVPIKRQRSWNIFYDEEWRNAGNFYVNHVGFRLDLAKCQTVFRTT